jgi:hypothetical protein
MGSKLAGAIYAVRDDLRSLHPIEDEPGGYYAVTPRRGGKSAGQQAQYTGLQARFAALLANRLVRAPAGLHSAVDDAGVTEPHGEAE